MTIARRVEKAAIPAYLKKGMSDVQTTHPYQVYVGTREWTAIDRALLELADNNDLQESTAHPYIVGYICKALAQNTVPDPRPIRSREEVLAILSAAQKEFQAAVPPGRDILAEFFAERREAAANGD